MKAILFLLMLCLGTISMPVSATKLHNEMPPYLLEFQQTVQRQAALFGEYYFLSVPTQKKRIALTFDDGPDAKNTPQVLDILKAYGVMGTFFLIGDQVERFPAITKRIHEEGHEIGNHSYSHPDMRKLSHEEIALELEATSRAIKEHTGIYPKTMRPPYGALLDDAVAFLGDAGWTIINWSIDTFDWETTATTESITEKIESYHHLGAIVLMHSNRSALVEALPLVIEFLLREGYEFVTVETLLQCI